MSAPLSLVRLRPDLPALARWGIGRGYLSRQGEADFGYVLHVALRDGLGRLAPRPFVLRVSRGANEAGELLGYVRATPETMKEVTALPPVNGSASALDLAAMEVRAMPEYWRTGARFSFEVRVRPIVRTRRGGRATPKKRAEVDEVDAAAWAAHRVRDDTGCCFSVCLVESPGEFAGLFRRRIAWDDGAIWEAVGVGAGVFVMNRCCRSGEDVGARAASVGKGWASAQHLSMPCPHAP